MRLEHIGIAVSSAADATNLLARILGIAPYKSEVVASEHVRTVFFDAGGPKLELLEATSADSPIAKHIERRGEGLHHIAFDVPDLDAAFERLRAAGFRLLNESPKRGADGKRIFFVHPKDTAGVLIELCASAPLPLKPDYAPDGDRRIAYYVGGRPDAPPLVLLHAAMGSVEMELRRLLDALAPHFRTVAVDFAGHGRSDDLGEETPDIVTFAGNVEAVMDHLGLDRSHLFGFSMGGSTALYLAHARPERFERIAIHGTNVQWDAEEAEAMIAAMQPDAIESNQPRWARRLAEAHGPERWKTLAHQMIAFTRKLPTQRFLDDDLARIDRPVLVSHGDSDRYFRIDHALHLWRTLPNAQLAIHPGIDHPIQGVDARGFAAMLRTFLLD